MKIFISGIVFACTGLFSAAQAAISPLVVSSEFHNDSWFPLPIEQMESAAVDTALAGISASGQFAFLFNPSPEQSKNTGSLMLKVSLVEPAESAKITIRLSLPNNQGTYVSSTSTSLSHRNHQGIFDALQQMGTTAANELNTSLESASKQQTPNPDQQAIRDQIIALNLKLIKLNGVISESQFDTHNTAILQQLGKLDTIISKIDAHHEYNKRSDIEKNKKLDAIYSEIQKLNVGSNTDNKAPDGNQLTEYDISQLAKITKASQLKFAKRFADARTLLDSVSKDRKISDTFRRAVDEELNINLPLYEAEIITNEVSGMFMKYVKNDEYKAKLRYISDLYERVLAHQDLAFNKQIEIRQKQERLNLTTDSMNTAVIAMKANSMQMLKMQLRDTMARHNVYRAMGISKGGSGSGDCPDRKTIDTVIQRSNVSSTVLAYTGTREQCTLTLEDSTGQRHIFTFSEEDISYLTSH